jgi:hypothetical protein
MTTYGATSCGPDATAIGTDVLSRTIPQSVLTYLSNNGGATVSNLLVLANKALGGVSGLPSYSDINQAVSAINELYDECRFDAPSVVAVASAKSSSLRIAKGAELGSSFSVYPNPFSDVATIEFSQAKAQNFSLELYDVTGRMVKRIASGTTEAGKRYRYQVESQYLPEGMYMVRLITGKSSQTFRLTMSK